MESATLDLPGIDESMLATSSAPPAPKTRIATATAGEIDLKKIDLQAVALAQFGDWEARAADVNTRHGGVIFQNVDTTKGLAALRAALAETKQVRFDAQNVSKAIKSKMATTSKAVGAKEAEIAQAVEKTETDLQSQVDAEESRRAEAKRIEEEKAAARRQVFEDKVAGIRGYLAMAQGLPSVRVEKGVTFLTAMMIGDEWDEFKAIAEKARDETLASLRALLAKVQAEEVAAAERERVRLENERLAAELAEGRRQLEAQRAELARQAEALAAAQRAAAPTPADLPKEDPPAPSPTPQPAPTPTPVIAAPAPAALLAVLDAEREESAMRFDGAVASALADQVNGGLGLGLVTIHVDTGGEIVAKHIPLIDVVKADPPEEGAAPAAADLPALLAHIAKAFDTKFPSQPKPSIEWWAELKRLSSGLSA